MSKVLGKIKRDKLYYYLIAPGILYFLIFHYVPIYGIIVAFKDVSPFDGLKGIFESSWVGFKHFKVFIDSYYFWNVLENTIVISFYRILFGFPAPIILALLINEIGSTVFKRVVQTVSYLPHFISMVILAGFVSVLLSVDGGLVNSILQQFGHESQMFLADPAYFRSIIVGSYIWKEVGWNSILYLAAIAGVDPQLYEAAKMDGANRFRQMWNITLPGILPIIVILLILQIGSVMDAGFEQIFLLYSPPVYAVSDIIDTYVYRKGLEEIQYSFAAAVGLFKSVIALVLIIGANKVAKKLGQEGIW